MMEPRPRIGSEHISYYAMQRRAISSLLVHTLTDLSFFRLYILFSYVILFVKV